MNGLTDEDLRQITVLLDQWASGDSQALAQATELVYADLRRIAAGYLNKERSSHTLQPTALLHEAYLRLSRIQPDGFENRRQFLGLAARVMRQILVDYARHAATGKRGGGATRIELSDQFLAAAQHQSPEQFLELEQALGELASFSPRKAEIMDLRYFCGLSLEETAVHLGISAATVSRDQRVAEAWLLQRLDAGPAK